MPAGSYLKMEEFDHPWRSRMFFGLCKWNLYPKKNILSGTVPPNEVHPHPLVTLGTSYPTGRYGVDQSGDNFCVSKAPYLNCSQFCILRFHTSTGSNCGPVGSDKLGDEMVEEITRNQLRHQCFLSYIGKSYLGIIFQLLKEISQNIQWVKQKNTHIPLCSQKGYGKWKVPQERESHIYFL